MYGTAKGHRAMRLDLTDRFLKTIKAEKTAAFFDAKVPGLHVIVSPAGVKSWSIIFTLPGTEKRARLSGGTYPATGLASARAWAMEARSKIEAGIDPRSKPDAPAGAPGTVAELVESYIKKHGSALKTSKALADRFRRDVVPIIGSVKLEALHRRDVTRVVDAIKDRGSPQSAAKVHSDLRAMFRWALDRGDLDHDPLAGAKAPTASKPRERFLREDEIRTLWPALSVGLPSIALALKLALVTGQRIGEIVGITEDEIDCKKALWTIPAERSKNGTKHTVPLSDMALNLIAVARRSASGGRLFRLTTMAVSQTLVNRRAQLPIQDWTAHDLRRSACTHMVGLGVSPLVVAHVANHKSQTRGTVTLAHYVQYSFDAEKREALELWAERLQAIIGGGVAQVIALNTAARR